MVNDGAILVIFSFCISLAKLLMIYSYRSTDYEVHRNWLAITHSLPLDKWYVENTSEWTLDYPPFFAWFEFLLSQMAGHFDPEMVKVSNLNYVSESSILFHRLSVIVSDLVYLYAAYHFSMVCVPRQPAKGGTGILDSPKVVVGVLLMGNFGLYIVDHIHFQYNGFMYGILLLSITAIYERRYMTAALHFATLLNFKHIYLYVAPAYGIYLLRVCCFEMSKKDGSIVWKSFSVHRFSLLAGIVVAICGMSLGPFIYMKQFLQLLSRLFPFKRGLCHAYWAPNFWALYNLADKLLHVTGRWIGLIGSISSPPAAMTGGLVQEFSHAVLPSIAPAFTFLVTAVFMAPLIQHLWNNPSGPRSFLRCLTLCAFTSFMFGWHVHEKAILLVLIPLTLLSLENQKYSRFFLFLSITGHVSLLPLIFTQFEQPLVYFGLAAFTLYSWISLSKLFKPGGADGATSLLSTLEKLYLGGLSLVVLYYAVGHKLLGLNETLPFLPLLLMSGYTAVGVTYSYVTLYSAVLSEKMLIKLGKQ